MQGCLWMDKKDDVEFMEWVRVRFNCNWVANNKTYAIFMTREVPMLLNAKRKWTCSKTASRYCEHVIVRITHQIVRNRDVLNE